MEKMEYIQPYISTIDNLERIYNEFFNLKYDDDPKKVVWRNIQYLLYYLDYTGIPNRMDGENRC